MVNSLAAERDHGGCIQRHIAMNRCWHVVTLGNFVDIATLRVVRRFLYKQSCTMSGNTNARSGVSNRAKVQRKPHVMVSYT